MNIKIISDNIAWDGQYFFCRRCGKSGYNRMAEIKGHLAMCPGKAMQKGAVPQQLAAASWQLAGYASNASLERVPASQLPAAATASYSQLDNNQLVAIDERVRRLENEYNHVLLAQNNPGSPFDPKFLVMILVGVLLFVYLTKSESSCNSDQRSNSSIGKTLAGKAVSKIFDRGVDKMLKGI